LRKICDFLELAYNPVMLEYHRFASDRLAEITRPFGPLDTTPTDIKRFLSIYEKTKRPPDPSRVGRWRTEMPDRELKRYEEIASELLGELGYETRSNRTWATEI
jgi:hypothetical protein